MLLSHTCPEDRDHRSTLVPLSITGIMQQAIGAQDLAEESAAAFGATSDRGMKRGRMVREGIMTRDACQRVSDRLGKERKMRLQIMDLKARQQTGRVCDCAAAVLSFPFLPPFISRATCVSMCEAVCLLLLRPLKLLLVKPRIVVQWISPELKQHTNHIQTD